MRCATERLHDTTSGGGRALATIARRSPDAPIPRRFYFALALLTAMLLMPAGASFATDAPTDAERAVDAAYQFTLGKLLFEENDYEGARAAYERALELDDSDVYGHLELAQLFGFLAQVSRNRDSRLHHLLSAAERAEMARERAPENADVLKGYAQIHMRLAEQRIESLELAREAYEKLREMTPEDIQVLTSLGQIYLWKRQPAKAAEVLEVAANYLPQHRALQAMLSEALLEAGENDKAVESLERLVGLDPANLDQRLRLVELLGRRGEHRRAVEILRGVPEASRGDLRVRRAFARELHLAGFNFEALGEVDTLIENMPGDRRMRRLRMHVLMGLTRYADAAAEMKPLIKNAEDASQALQDRLLLSRLLERSGNRDQALDELRRAVDGAEGEELLRLRMALVGALQRHGQGEEAVAELRDAASSADLEVAAMLAPALAEVLMDAGRGEEAAEALDQAIERATAAGKDESVESLRLHQLGVLSEAEDWARVIELAPEIYDTDDPTNGTNARLLAAQALAELGRLDEGLELLDEGSDAPRQRRLTTAARIDLLFNNDREAEARTALDEIIGEGSIDDLFFAAQLYQRSERYNDVVPLMERLLEAEPDTLQALFTLGAARERLGEHDAAVEAFQRLLDQQPDHAPSLNYLGYMWAERGENLEESLRLIQRAVALNPDNGAYVDSLGWVHFQIGNYERAREHLEWAALLIPEDPTIHEHLGDLYLKLEDPEQARAAYAEAVRLDGDNLEAAKRKLTELEAGGALSAEKPPGEPPAGGNEL